MMKNKIIQILSENRDEYVSGQELSGMLGVSRTAVWKAVNSLKSMGYDIEGVNNRGYRLISVPDIMSFERVEPDLTTDAFARNYIYFDETDSTNMQAKKAGESCAPHGSLYVADCQTAGRGRRGRDWDSPRGCSVFMSYLLRPDIEIGVVSRITIIAAYAVAYAIRRVTGIQAQIKWPNDVVADGRKVCGILSEMSSEGMDINYVVCGIGINVNNKEFPDVLQDKATSLYLVTGKRCDRARLIAEISNEFEKAYYEFVRTGELTFILNEYNDMLVNRGSRVVISDNDSVCEYTAVGLQPDGSLRVKTDEGEIKDIISGEVSVRGIYGYV